MINKTWLTLLAIWVATEQSHQLHPSFASFPSRAPLARAWPPAEEATTVSASHLRRRRIPLIKFELEQLLTLWGSGCTHRNNDSTGLHCHRWRYKSHCDSAGHARAAPVLTAAVEEAGCATNAVMVRITTADLLNSCCQLWQGCCLPSPELEQNNSKN